MKKIIFTVTTDLCHDQRMIRICDSLARNNYEVLLVGRRLKKSKPLENQLFNQKRLYCFFQKGKFFYLEYNIRLLFFLLFQRFDVVCGIDLDTILPCFLIGKIKKKPIVYDAHEYFTEVPEVTHRKITKGIWEAVARFCIPRVHYRYTVGEQLAVIFSNIYRVHFEVIRNIATQKTNLRVPFFSEKKIILYQGALNEGRGLTQYIEAMQYINNAELHLAGDGDLSDFLKKQVAEKKLAHKVKFLGNLSPTALQTVTQNAYIGLNLLENKGLSYYYSLANKTFDYLQAEIPALHPPFPEYEAIIKQYSIGILCDLKVENIVKNLNLLLNDDIFYQKIKTECLKAKSIFTWEQEEEKLLRFYKNIN
jgi:glycosyltransferase involved in cell wall biosynthesis